MNKRNEAIAQSVCPEWQSIFLSIVEGDFVSNEERESFNQHVEKCLNCSRAFDEAFDG